MIVGKIKFFFNYPFVINDYDLLILRDLVEEHFRTVHPIFCMYTNLSLCTFMIIRRLTFPNRIKVPDVRPCKNRF